MSTQVRIYLDSGTVLIEDWASYYPELEIGYFEPKIEVYCGGSTPVIIPTDKIIGPGKTVDFRHFDAKGTELRGGVNCNFKELLRWSELYPGGAPARKKEKFHVTFNFNSGYFHCHDVRFRRHFEEFLGVATTTNRKPHDNIAHDLIVEYTLDDGELLKIKTNSNEVWSSASCRDVKAIELRLPVRNETAYMFFRDVLDLGPSQKYWLPNQGQPPPMGGP